MRALPLTLDRAKSALTVKSHCKKLGLSAGDVDVASVKRNIGGNVSVMSVTISG